MNDYILYHNINVIKDNLQTYTPSNKLTPHLDDMLKHLSTKLYRVAVVGEFKRGKSSLINTLLGTEVLPTDILPATAVVNRIVYSPTRKIEIHYKDGRREETTVDELHNYATKLDTDKAKTANSIREIVVYYPSYFCQNHIELFDTPGLNDDEKMTETTFEVLDKIDTAIVVISATMPLSMSEQNLICSLIEQKDIYHLVFAITFIDRVSDDEEDQDRLIELLKRRIQSDTYELFYKSHSENTELLKKAENILKNPDIFAVSSRQAMQGFIKNDKSLIKKSRFEHFKIGLLTQLTANQELDAKSKIKRILSDIKNSYASDISLVTGSYGSDIYNEENILREIEQCSAVRYSSLIRSFQKMDNDIEKLGISLSNEAMCPMMNRIEPHRYFVKELSSITQNNFTPGNVMTALKRAMSICNNDTNQFGKIVSDCIEDNIRDIEKITDKNNAICRIDAISANRQKPPYKFPHFEMTESAMLAGVNNIMGNIIPTVMTNWRKAFIQYQASITAYIASRRSELINFENKNIQRAGIAIKDQKQVIADKKQQKSQYEEKSNESKNFVIKMIDEIITEI